MVVYEVNLKISNDAFVDYVAWLTPHVEEMLTFKGFKSAKYLNEERSDEDGFHKMTVQYMVDSMSNLDDYLENHSQRMRKDGTEKFPDKFSATRRFFEVTREFTPCSESKLKAS